MASDVAGDSSKRLLWITGKAGTGKSTLMKFALGKARDPSKRVKNEQPSMIQSLIRYFRYLPGARASEDVGQAPDLVLSHFFNARGSALEKSTEGMYRTLLVQLLEQLPQLEDALPRGVSLLRESVKRLDGQPVVYYVDALDECNKSEVRKMVKVFQSLIQEAAESGQKLRVCFASRPYPHISSDLAVRLQLESQDAHRKDIKMYVMENLRIGNGTQAERIATQLLHKANGVFLWVALVVERANEEHDDGRWDRCEEWLKGVPGDLNKLYSEMLEREISEEDKQAQMLLFQFLLFSAGSLSPREMWLGVQLGLGQEAGDNSEVGDKVEEIRRRDKEVDDEAVARYIGSISRGLTECVAINYGYMYVQFIHESAREFVVGEDGLLMKMTSAKSLEEMELVSRGELKRGCERVLDGCSAEINKAKSQRDMYTLEGENRILWYVRLYVLDHAEALQRKGQDQGAWLSRLHKRFQGRLWIFWSEDHPESKVSMLDILLWGMHDALLLGAESGQMQRLLLDEARQFRYKGRAPGVRVEGSMRSPLLMALAYGTVEAVKYLVNVYLKLEQRPEPVQNTLERLRDDDSGAMLLMADNNEKLAIFFLVALTPPASLNDNLAQALQRHATQGYAATLNFIFKHNLPNHLIIFGQIPHFGGNTHRHLSRWAKEHKHDDLAATLRTPEVQSRFGLDTEDSA
jgi:hypothetical protein